MPDPVRLAPSAPLPLPSTPPSALGTASSPSPEVSSLLDAAVRLLPGLEPEGPVAASVAPSVLADQLVAAYQDGGALAVLGLLRASPDAVASLGLTNEGALEDALAGALDRAPFGLRTLLPDSLRSATIEGAVRTYLESAVRSRIYTQVESLVGGLHRTIDALEAALPSQLEALRQASPSTPLGALASYLGIRGDAGDLERATAVLEQRRTEGTEFLEYLASPSLWETHELPGAAWRAAQTLGFGHAPEGTLGASVVGGDDAPVPGGAVVQLAYQRLLQQGLQAVGIGSNPASAVAAGAMVLLGTFDELNDDRHEAFLSFAHSMGL